MTQSDAHCDSVLGYNTDRGNPLMTSVTSAENESKKLQSKTHSEKMSRSKHMGKTNTNAGRSGKVFLPNIPHRKARWDLSSLFDDNSGLFHLCIFAIEGSIVAEPCRLCTFPLCCRDSGKQWVKQNSFYSQKDKPEAFQNNSEMNLNDCSV